MAVLALETLGTHGREKTTRNQEHHEVFVLFRGLLGPRVVAYGCLDSRYFRDTRWPEGDLESRAQRGLLDRLLLECGEGSKAKSEGVRHAMCILWRKALGEAWFKAPVVRLMSPRSQSKLHVVY